ncbi:TetR/AcrR family transcriptional regulator [Acidicapsa dinghuensis]|uniref:TetR/AcrR family transcriptional regulator n=1 Tax=Acidicapsa dinghuensis TaxID=2218256 RepID=A0ABW1EE13_9BACT|nr:TetR/AcrR family transcriptional regulator [Acidicapsa dinghuensis]
MPKTAEDRKRQIVTEFRRSEILDAASKVFGTKGFDESRVDDIAAQAGLAKATVYVYFRSKDEIYEAVMERALAEIYARTGEAVASAASFAEKLGAFIAIRLTYWREKQDLYRVISSINREMKNRKRSLKWQRLAVDYLIAMFTTAAERAEIPKQDFEAAAWAIMDMIRGIHERRIIQHGPHPEEEARQLTAFCLKALGYNATSKTKTK